MEKAEKGEQKSQPSCPNPRYSQSHMVHNGSHRGRQRYLCKTCQTYFGETEGTPMYGLKTPVAEVAQALLIVMRRGSLRGAEEINGHKYETIGVWLKRAASQAEVLTEALASDLHLSQVEIDKFWSFVAKKRARRSARRGRTLGMSDSGSRKPFRDCKRFWPSGRRTDRSHDGYRCSTNAETSVQLVQ